MIHSTDQLGRTLTLPHPARRIVSLVPSITETLFDLGCSDEVLGITKFCTHPESWFRSKTRIGGTKTFHPAKIKALQPDLILANKEENDAELVQSLMSDFPVWVSDVKNEADALTLLSQLGQLVGREARAKQYIAEINKALVAFRQQSKAPKKVVYMIWKDPIMVAGGDTYINSMIELCGWQNCFADHNRYPSISPEALAEEAPDAILLSSEPFPFSEKHIDFFQSICPTAVIQLVDGTYFSWYGSRLLPSIRYFGNLNHL